MVKLSIVIPAHNEEKRIGKTLQEYCSLFNRLLKKRVEIVVVVNNCSDNTEGVVRLFARKYSSVKCLVIPERIGKGGAVIEGFRRATGDVVGFVDADGATPARAFAELYQNMSGQGGIIASRWMKGARIKRKQPLKRRIASRGFNLLIRLLFGLNVSDTQCGAKLFQRKVVMAIVDDLSTTRWAFDVDLLYQLKRRGYEIKEVATEWDDRAESQLKMWKVVPEMFLAVVRLRLVYSPFSFVVAGYNAIADVIAKIYK